MALTPAEQAELDQLEAQEHDRITGEFGQPMADTYVDAVSKPQRPEDETHSSLMRTIVGGLFRDPIANTWETLKDVAGPIVAPGNVALAKSIEALPKVPDLPGSEHAGMAEKIGRGFLSYVIPFSRAAKAVNLGEAGLSVGSKILRGVAAGALTTAISQDPEQTNLATALKDGLGIDDPTLDALAYHADSPDLIERIKAAATSLPADLVATGIFESAAKGIQMYRNWKGAAEEARGLIDAMEHDYGIKRPKVEEPTPVNPEEASDALMRAGEASTEAFNPEIHSLLQKEPPKAWEDVLSFLNRIVDDPNLKNETVDELAKIAHEDPENALTRLGIDPAKLDYENFDNPEAVQNLHNALINIYEKAASSLGRTGVRVTEASIVHTAARAFASEADTLRALFGKTKNLPEILMGARMFVGGHAKRLLDDAEAALNALKEGGEGAGEQEWQKFLGSFYRHALYLGSLRGAGSEIARALRSLQMVAKHDPKAAIRYAETIEKMVPAGARADAEETAKTQLDALVSMDDDAERMMALSKLLEHGGDVGSVAAFVRRMNGSIGAQINLGVVESVGNLFTQETAAYNLASTLSFIGLRSLGRWMAATVRAPFGIINGTEANRLARIARADAWAYTDGLMLSWSEAWRNMMTRLTASGATELFLNADNLGLKKVAKLAAKWNAEGALITKQGKNFERVDMSAAQHIIALSPSDRRAIEAWIEHYNMPRLMEGAMKFLARTAGVAINAAGTATRLGTILFVNAPDEFAGTLAYNAGSQSAAVREAARRAAELGIEGKDLSAYLKARVASLADGPAGLPDQAYEAGFRDTIHKAGQHESREVLFQDRLETGFGRGAEWLIGHTPIIGPLAVPFVHTPMRILERSLIDYTPLGLVKSRMRRAILSGTPEQREQALSQMALGIMAMYLGYHLTGTRAIVGKDGSFFSTARMARESYTIKVGGDTFDFSRMDPLATVIGLAADYHEYMNTYYDPHDPQSESYGHAMLEAIAWAFSASALSKTYLKSLQNLTDLAGAFTDGEFRAHWNRYWQDTLARRAVPAAGVQKGIREVVDPWEHEAISFTDKLLNETIGATKLPIKRNWLGEPVETNIGERFLGLGWEPYKGNDDALLKELDWVSASARLPRKDIKGVQLTAAQYSRLLELRGQVDGKYGKLRDGLSRLIALPEYQGLSRDAKEYNIRDLADGYTHEATKALLSEDKNLQGQVWLEEAYQDAKNQGVTGKDLDTKVQQFRAELQQLGYL